MYKKHQKTIRESPYFTNEDKSDSLTGIDLNQNNVRDDVERYIDLKYPKHSEYNALLKLLAQTAWHNMATASNNKESYRPISHRKTLIMVCVSNESKDCKHKR